MALAKGTGPFGRSPAGTFNLTMAARGDDVPTKDDGSPAHALYLEPSPRRVRAALDGEIVADSTKACLLHETGAPPVYYFPLADLAGEFLEDSDHSTFCPFKGQASYFHVRVGDRRVEDAVWYYPDPVEGAPPLAGYAAFYWRKMDAWYEEDEQVFVHPRDPYHRVDVLSSSRHVRVDIGDETVAESDRPLLLFETGLPTRYYLDPEDVREELLVSSDHHTDCPYKGTASYYSVKAPDGDLEENVLWYYPEPIDDCPRIAGRYAFYNERVDLYVDGELQDAPDSPFA